MKAAQRRLLWGLFILMLVSGLGMAAEVRSSFTVSSNKSKVLVNGVATNLEAYNIDGFNYFKLRDIALVVNGTNKQFNVTWDGNIGAINLVAGSSYVKTGTELAVGDGAQKKAFFNSASIYKDGKRVILGAYTINDNNFFKLRDLCQTFNIGVTWDAVSATIGIDTSISYVAPKKTPVWVTPNYTDDFDRVISPAGEGYFMGLRSKNKDTWDQVITIYDDALKPVIKTEYRSEFYGTSFSHGLMPVTTATQWVDGTDYNGVKNYLFGYIDPAGNVIIPEKYYSVTGFKYGIACVHEMRNDTAYTLLIDTTGKVVYERPEFLSSVIGGDGRVWFWETDEYISLPENILARHSGYWGWQGDQWIETPSVYSPEEATFRQQYGKLYGKIEPLGFGFFRVENASHPIMEGIVNSKNQEIVPRGSTDSIDVVYTDTSIFFVVGEDTQGIYDGRSVINSSGVKILTHVHMVDFAGGEAIHYFQHDANGNSMYGLIDTSGTHIAPLSYTYLTSQDPYNGIKALYFELLDPGYANTRIYTAGNLQERADVTDLKKELAIAQDLYQKVGAIWDPDYKGRDYNEMAKYIARAQSILVLEKPTWMDVSVTEIWLGLMSATLQTVVDNWNSR